MADRDHRRQTAYSDPRAYAQLVSALPATVPELGAVVRNVLVHYRGGLDFPPDRLEEIESRWVDRMIGHDQRRFPGVPLARERAPEERVVGCCRDFTLLTVAALRLHGVPARSRVGFADYLQPEFHVDHVITEWWDGSRWIAADTEFDPAAGLPVDPLDVPLADGGLVPASRVWQAFRRGELDPSTYGVGPGVPIGGGWFIRDYVLHEVAHRYGDELLLWDRFGAMSHDLDGDLGLIDEVAALLVAADAGDEAAERRLAGWYATDDRLHPGPAIVSESPRGSVTKVDLAARA
ncbi:hypothetical protein Asp14428_64230 [Actinoplanes sp. NBRC 14428]|nr:hypothetical protein Asp14428_64230 [Actinoplanes sp. NBRC 14428]